MPGTPNRRGFFARLAGWLAAPVVAKAAEAAPEPAKIEPDPLAKLGPVAPGWERMEWKSDDGPMVAYVRCTTIKA